MSLGFVSLKQTVYNLVHTLAQTFLSPLFIVLPLAFLVHFYLVRQNAPQFLKYLNFSSAFFLYVYLVICPIDILNKLLG